VERQPGVTPYPHHPTLPHNSPEPSSTGPFPPPILDVTQIKRGSLYLLSQRFEKPKLSYSLAILHPPRCWLGFAPIRLYLWSPPRMCCLFFHYSLSRTKPCRMLVPTLPHLLAASSSSRRDSFFSPACPHLGILCSPPCALTGLPCAGLTSLFTHPCSRSCFFLLSFSCLPHSLGRYPPLSYSFFSSVLSSVCFVDFVSFPGPVLWSLHVTLLVALGGGGLFFVFLVGVLVNVGRMLSPPDPALVGYVC